MINVQVTEHINILSSLTMYSLLQRGMLSYTPVTRRSVNAVTPPPPKQTDCSVTFIILCVAVTRHDFCVTPSRLIEGTAARPSYDSPTNCVTGPRRAHDRHGIIILIHDRRTTPSRRFQDLCVTLLGYIKSCSKKQH